MRKIVLFIFVLMINSVFGQDFDKNLYEKIKQAEKLQHVEPFEKVERFFNREIDSNAGKNSVLAYLHAYKSRFYTLNDSLILAKKEADLSLSLAENSKNPQAKAAALLAQLYINAVLGLNDKAIENGKEALKINQSSDDFFTNYLLNYKLYAIYSDWSEVDKMKFYINQAIKIAEKSRDYNAMSNAYNGASSTCLSEYEITKNATLIQQSWEYLQKSFELYRSHPTEIAESTLSVTCNNIANHFLSFSKLSISEAKKQAFEYLDLIENMPKKDALVLANVNGIKSVFALRENDLNLAKAYLEKAQKIIEKEPRKNLETKIRIHQSLLNIATAQAQYQQGLQHSQKINELQSELFDQAERYNAQKIEIQYEVEKKNQELRFLTTQIALKKKQNYLYIGLFIASVLGLFFMFRSYHFRLRYSIERERKTQLEKEDAQKQILLEQEEKQRLKAEQELLEMQQQQLRKEAMATVLQVQRKNEILQEIKSKLAQGDAQNLQKIFREEAHSDADFEEIKAHFLKIHPTFFQQLQDKAQQKLSLLDQKYCAYIHLKFSTKQIANLLNIEASSVRMFKYRLKQKFALPKEVDLDKFLQEI